MNYEKRKQFIKKFKPIGDNLKQNFPKASLWDLDNILRFMAFDWQYYDFKAKCEREGVECCETRNQNAINFEKYFMGLKMNESEFMFYSYLNDSNLKTLCTRLLK